jgi:hypothetical protein
MKRSTLFGVVILSILFCQFSIAQFNAGAFLGFKSYGLKGAGSTTQNGQRSVSPIADAGGTVFSFGGFGGYTAIKGGMYNLDLQLAASYASIGFLERGFNSINGAGSFAANGLSGGKTSAFEFDILGLNRFTFHGLKILEPYAGLGMSFNIYSTSDLVSAPANYQSVTVTGNSEFKIGLIIAYGAILKITPGISPYIQFTHLLPFGSETQVTNDVKYTTIINDVPGYFSLTAGVRFDF